MTFLNTLQMDMPLSMHMIFVMGMTVFAIVAFIRERISVEIVSAFIFAGLLLFGHLFPYLDDQGQNMLDPVAILAGLANPSLIAVMALLVLGQALIQTDTLRLVTSFFALAKPPFVHIALYGIFIFVMVMSAFVNNTPLVVIAIPLVQVLAFSNNISESRLMIPLSYVAILGGMTTVIGSSTNLLVSNKMLEMGYSPLSFFGFVVPGSVLAAVGFVYVVLLLPRLLRNRASMARSLMGLNKEFIAELEIAPDSKLIGTKYEKGRFGPLGDLSVRMIQRGGQLLLAPFEDYVIEAGDILIGSANRKVLTKILASYPGSFLSDDMVPVDDEDETGPEGRVLAEIMVTPASRCIDMLMEHAALDKKYSLTILGIQRRARIVRRRLGRVRLEAGDVLLVAGTRSIINALRDNIDFIVLSGSKRDLPTPAKAPMAVSIFLGVIVTASLGILSVPVAAVVGAVAMIAVGCLNIQQALRAVDRKIYLLVASMLALGTAMEVTGGVQVVANVLLDAPIELSTFGVLSIFFLIVAVLTNVLSNNACAILFTPIAVNLAESLQIPPDTGFSLSYIFAVTVVFAANCSFASPIGYQTNLLVMGPGHYRFSDFIRAGVPLVLILWVTYMGLLKFYFGI